LRFWEIDRAAAQRDEFLAASFEHLIGTAEQRKRKGDAKRAGRLEVDVKVDLGGLLHRQICWLLALENAADINADQTIRLGDAATVAYQAAGRGELAKLEDRGHAQAEAKRAELFA